MFCLGQQSAVHLRILDHPLHSPLNTDAAGRTLRSILEKLEYTRDGFSTRNINYRETQSSVRFRRSRVFVCRLGFFI